MSTYKQFFSIFFFFLFPRGKSQIYHVRYNHLAMGFLRTNKSGEKEKTKGPTFCQASDPCFWPYASNIALYYFWSPSFNLD